MASNRTEAELAREALAVQDACNLSGVVHAFSRAVSDLWAIANANGHGTDWVNRHPVSKLFADKLADLARVRETSDFSAAYDAARKLAGEGAV